MLSVIWRDERVRFLAVGGFNTLFGFVVYSLLYYTLGEHIHYIILAIAAHFVSVAFAFVMYRRYVFMSDAPIFGELIRYNATVLGNLVFGIAALSVLVDYAGYHPVIAQAEVITLVVLANYLLHKNFTFR